MILLYVHLVSKNNEVITKLFSPIWRLIFHILPWIVDVSMHCISNSLKRKRKQKFALPSHMSGFQIAPSLHKRMLTGMYTRVLCGVIALYCNCQKTHSCYYISEQKAIAVQQRHNSNSTQIYRTFIKTVANSWRSDRRKKLYRRVLHSHCFVLDIGARKWALALNIQIFRKVHRSTCAF